MNINNQVLNNTKIIATAGPTFGTYEQALEMIKRGVNVVRMNMSHGSLEVHQERLNNIRKASAFLDVPVAFMLDTRGPEIRMHLFENESATIKYGQEVKIVTSHEILGNSNEFSVNYKGMYKILKAGQEILCDDGKLSLQVTGINEETGDIYTIAKNNHVLYDNKAVNIPGRALTIPFISTYDKESIEWGLNNNIDYIAASFVAKKEDINTLRSLLEEHNKSYVQIISKVESLQAIQNLNEIVESSDAIMIARGDLGVEIPFQKVPFYEKLIINKCRASSKPVIIATQMLDSMKSNPRPTRAEVTDVYYSTISGADATMLSVESANGSFPFEAVEVMSKINYEAETNFSYQDAYEQAYTYVKTKNAEASYTVSKKVKNNAIKYVFALSENGRLLRALSSFRTSSRVIGLVKEPYLVTYFGIWYGVYGHLVDNFESLYEDEELFIKLAHQIGVKDQIIILACREKYKQIKV